MDDIPISEALAKYALVLILLPNIVLSLPAVEQGLTVEEMRVIGEQIFITRLTHDDGFGDGRPKLQGNPTLTRVNGLDAQSCNECHSIVSNTEVPPLRGIGGSGDISNSAIFKPESIFPFDDDHRNFDGRLINPPSLFGIGLVEQLGVEMTEDLQAIQAEAAETGESRQLTAKGVNFGDTSQPQGVDEDLVIKPFGRKGEFPTILAFDIAAFEFHFGLQSVAGDPDEDGVVDEVTASQLDAVSLFIASLPFPTKASNEGRDLFDAVGCSGCHASLALNDGTIVDLFSDLKRHDMGDSLAENFTLASDQQNREFISAKLMGVADTAPYLHDGRALTLLEAILLHDGEALDEREAFEALDDGSQNLLIEFLQGLRNPR